MSTTIADIRRAAGYRVTCPEGPLGKVDDDTARLDAPVIVFREGRLRPKRFLVDADKVRHVDHERHLLSLNGTYADLHTYPYTPGDDDVVAQVIDLDATPESTPIPTAPMPTTVAGTELTVPSVTTEPPAPSKTTAEVADGRDAAVTIPGDIGRGVM